MLERKEWLNNEQRKEKREEKEQRAYVVVSYMLPTVPPQLMKRKAGKHGIYNTIKGCSMEQNNS